MSAQENCLFCKIAKGEMPATMVHSEPDFYAIADINPQAPTHILLIPREHSQDITELSDADTLGRLFQAAKGIAAKANLHDGFRLVVNTGPAAGQTVPHLHVHLLGGRSMSWPPG